MQKELINKAKELLEPFRKRYDTTLSPIHWVEQDGCSIDGDFCEKCITEAVENAIKSHAKKGQDSNPTFSSTHNVCGGYESDNFLTCDICGKGLNIAILPSEQNIQYVLDDLDSGEINDQIGYEAYCLLDGCWEDNDHKEEILLTNKLAEKIIEILA
ncbi:MAG: hypothetical protein WCT77_05860 [Bacteroidota bacterium]